MVKRILFLCTANSARSILAEAIANRTGGNRLQAYSAGSHPRGIPHPTGLSLLESKGYDPSVFRSKSWDEFATPEAPMMDIVITVCDAAAGEACPLWHGAPLRAHWGIPDPAHVGATEEERLQAFDQAYQQMERRISAFLALPFETMDKPALKLSLERIGLQALESDKG